MCGWSWPDTRPEAGGRGVTHGPEAGAPGLTHGPEAGAPGLTHGPEAERGAIDGLPCAIGDAPLPMLPAAPAPKLGAAVGRAGCSGRL